MDIWPHVSAMVDALVLRDPTEIASALLVLLAAPFITFWSRSIVLAGFAIAVSVVPLWWFVREAQHSDAALWVVGAWLALNLLQVAAVMHNRHMLLGQDLLERLSEIEYRIDMFLDALDRRAALGSENADMKSETHIGDSRVRSMHESVS